MSQLIQNASTSLQFTILSKPTICVNLDRLAVPVICGIIIMHYNSQNLGFLHIGLQLRQQETSDLHSTYIFVYISVYPICSRYINLI